MATKAELAQESAEYTRLRDAARTALQHGNIDTAILHAVSSWPFIDGMMQFERKYAEREFETVETIEIVLEYAPLIFSSPSLDSLESLLSEKKRIEKNTRDNLGQKLIAARQLMWDARRLWNHVETHTNCRQDELRSILGGNQDEWRRIAEFWQQLGILHRTPEANSYRLAFVTNMEDHSPAKCPACGAIGKAKKGKLLEAMCCPRCNQSVYFLFAVSS